MKYFLFLYYLFLTNFLQAQKVIIPDTLLVNSLGQQQGLLQLNVKEMALDDLGYLWAGTEDGLFQFNGYAFKPYLHKPYDSTSIKDDHIRSLLFTKDTLWIATNTAGIAGFIPSQNKFIVPYSSAKNSDLNISYKVVNFGKKQLLFSVKNNIIVFNRVTKKIKIIALPKSARENYVTDIVQIGQDKYLLATSSSGILEFNSNSFSINNTGILHSQNIKCFYKQGDYIFIGGKKGLTIYNKNTKQLTQTSLTKTVNCFYKLSNTQFYIGTTSGLFLYHTEQHALTSLLLKTNKNILYKTIDINQIIGDEKGNLWIGTEGKGLLHLNEYQKKFSTLKLSIKEHSLLKNISSFQFLKGKDSCLFIGSKLGLVKYVPKQNSFKLYKNTSNQLIYTLIEDKNNNIWAGGFTTGLLKYDKKLDLFRKIKNTNTNLPDEDVIEIIPVDKNTLWICTWSGGIYKFNIKYEVFEKLLINGKTLNRARTSLIDSKGTIWLGTDEGVYKINKQGSAQRYHKQDVFDKKLSNDRIFSIKEDTDGNIWVGTSNGLVKLDIATNKTTLFFKQEGLPNDFIYSILIANNNDIWVSTNHGLSVLSAKTNTFKNYTKNDGLQNNEFNGKAGYKDTLGNFYFGGLSGINIFKPESIKENPFVPNVYIESVDLFNKPIGKNELFKDTLQFKSNENVITFNYAALNYLNPLKSNYTFKLEGFDDQWRPVTKDRSTTYTNLDPGNYIFKVKGSNDSGIWNEKPDTMQLIIIPPWYQTNTFKGILILLFLLSGPQFYTYKTKKLKKDKRKLEQIVLERTNEITLKNKNLKQVNREIEKQHNQIIFLMREMSHRIKNNLQIISSLLNIQANTLEYKPAVDALKISRNRILAISYIENKTTTADESIQIDTFIKNLTNNIITVLSDGDQLKFNIIYDLPNAKIKHLNTTLFGLILNELITNTIKYAFDEYHHHNTLKISCKINEASLKLIVSDNGKGYSLDKDVTSKSLGIELVTEMVDQLKGTITTNSKNGTKNIIDIPV